jgi:hypothetical protein
MSNLSDAKKQIKENLKTKNTYLEYCSISYGVFIKHKKGIFVL